MATRLELLGGFTLRSSDGEDVTPTSKKACALLAYLALQRGRSAPRGTVAALLWEESGDSQARGSLRQALAAIRRAQPDEEVVRSSADIIQLAPGVESDVEVLDSTGDGDDPAEVERAAGLYRGDLLEGFDPRAPAFEEWAAVERERLRRRAEELLTRLLHLHQERGDATAATTAATRILHLDPLREDVHRTLMSLYSKLGRRAAALNQYRACRQALARALGVDPEPETEELRRAIESERRRAGDGPRQPGADAPDPAPAAPEEEPLPPTPRPDRRLREVTMVTALAAPDGASSPPEQLAAAETELAEAMASVAASLGGTMIRRGPDGVVAAFGASMSHGNEPQRAVRAARTLVQRLDGARCRVRVGVATGLMLVDADPAAGVSGEPARRAAQLAARADAGQVLADAAVMDGLGGRLAAEPADDGWLVYGLHPIPGHASRLVGREGECRHLMSLLADCIDHGQGRTVVIRGEAGIGKTRLLHAALRSATERGVTTHLATVLDFGSPEDVERSLAAQLLGLDGDPDPAEAAAAVEGALASGLVDPEDRGHLLALLGATDGASGSPGEAGADRRRAQVLPALMSRAAGSGPLLVAVEDAHWAPPRIRRLLARLAAATADSPAILLITTRVHGDPLDAAWRASAAPCSLTAIDLGALRPEELAAMAVERADVAADALQECVRRADGNPLFFQQLVRAAATGAGELPGTIRSLVTSRMDCLSGRDQLAVEAAAALGQRFRLDTVRRLVEDPGWAPDAAVEEGLVRPDDDGWSFAHSLIRDAVYTSMPSERRRGLHLEAARLVAASDPALEAEHLEAAGAPEAAAAWLRAARQALARHRLEVVLDHAGRGIAVAGEGPDLHELELVRGESLELMGDLDGAATAFRSALAEADDDTRRGRARVGLASALRRAERHDEALSVLDRAHRELAATDAHEELARLEAIRSSIHFTLGRLDECLECTRRALESSRRAGSPSSEARALGTLGDAEYQRGRVARAHDHFDACVRLAEANGLDGVAVAHLGMRGLTRLYRLRVPEALADAREAARRAAGLGHLRAEMVAWNIAATVELEAGQPEEALASAERSIELAARLASRLFEAENLNMKAHVLGVLGRPDEGHALASRAWEISRDCGPAFSGPWILATVARLTDDPSRRRWALATGEEILDAGSSCHANLHYRQHAILGAVGEGRWSEARRHADALERYRGGEPFEMAELLTDCGRLLADWREGGGEPGRSGGIDELHRRASDAGLVLVADAIAAVRDA